ncbi:MAG TPA: carboxymuconolactone decarboxylase family protein [Methanothrix sp.]|nr:carboxymuconolactone decarboxylase family protein [Methanothrix sp.]HPC90352.1 carboxymuconolactone decarboxylase family protein [Methanothrix sp.]HQE88102.1 carboxymuconolactone decarboxylase family protein [Methanothrix sp.]HQI68721.1 carboxymuconolactone decarboxylase family protein [Methanothrix sp.]HRS85772.1 carboxymuconolactone decarboxylase family protein [Methanothrix sp.]
MKDEVFFGEGMARVKNEYPDLYKAIVGLNDAAYTGKALDYKTQKLIAIGINAAASDDRAIRKQMMSGMKELGITKDEIVDVLRVVLLTSGMPSFNKGMKILFEILEK